MGATIPLIPGLVRLHFAGDLQLLATTALFAAIGAIGLNIVTGFAGQVSLGHAFFLGLGAFTAAVLGGTEVTRQ
jgi:branched-chain amino acid transport system permease protein